LTDRAPTSAEFEQERTLGGVELRTRQFAGHTSVLHGEGFRVRA
jgi:hypothetical protein